LEEQEVELCYYQRKNLSTYSTKFKKTRLGIHCF
jgi:hypothetical protein